MGETKLRIEKVFPGTIAAEIGIEKSDILKSINGQQPRDLIDYRFQCADDELEIEVIKGNGELWVCRIEKEYDQDLGLGFAEDTFDGVLNCTNKCIFCFIDQMPRDLRESLYLKDDDYRLSFLHGNFITLTNLRKPDWERIVRMRISPLFISVHSTNPELRERLLGHKKAGKIMEQLTMLAQAGIRMHTQVVLCPDINDGEELDRTIRDLSSFWPQVESIAVVPVGLTRYRENLPGLRHFTSAEAGELIENIHRYQKLFLEKYDTPLVYLGDEFYAMARTKFPATKYYGDFPQLENGVGMVRLFYDSFEAEKENLPLSLPRSKKIAVVTGVSGEYVLRPVIKRLNKIKNLQLKLIRVDNEFFGRQVTAAGLLTGKDLMAALKDRLPFDIIVLPSVMCKSDEAVFLDGITPADVEKKYQVPVKVVSVDEGVRHLIEVILDKEVPLWPNRL